MEEENKDAEPAIRDHGHQPALTNPIADQGKQQELVLLQAQQEGLQNSFQSLTENLEQAAKSLVEESWARKLNATLGMLEQYQEDLNTVSREIKLCLTATEMTEHFKTDFLYQEKIQEFKQEVLAKQMMYYKDNPQSVSKPQNMVVIPTKVPVEDSKLVKLPPQKLPVFRGDYASWTPFLDSFQSMVGNKVNVSEPAKLGFLKSALQGEPHAMIMRLENDNPGNYARAMEILADRYQNTRAIVRTHLDTIINYPIVKSNNSKQLRNFIQCVENNLDGIRQAGIPIVQWEPIVAYHMYQKLNCDTRTQFEVANPGTEIQNVSQLLKFLKERAAASETYSVNGKPQQHESQNTNSQAGGSYTGQQMSGSDYYEESVRKKKCFMCNGDHTVYRCDFFHDLKVEQREEWVMDNNLCRNCLKRGHVAVKCVSNYVCRVCKKRHNSLLHFSAPVDVVQSKCRGDVNHTKQGNYNQVRPPAQASTVVPTSVPIQLQVMVTTVQGCPVAATGAAQVAGTSLHSAPRLPSTYHTTGTSDFSYQSPDTDEDLHIPLLGTATVPVLNSEGMITCGRALLDSGSQINLVTDKFASKLGLRRKARTGTVSTIGVVLPSVTIGTVRFVIATSGGDRLYVTAHILTEVTESLPTQAIVLTSDFSQHRSTLADSTFDQPGEIDLLIGCEIYEELMLGGKKKFGKITATRSRLGWVITGTVMSGPPEFNGEMGTAAVQGRSMHLQSGNPKIINSSKVNRASRSISLAKAPYAIANAIAVANTVASAPNCIKRRKNACVFGRRSEGRPFKDHLPDEPNKVIGGSREPAVRALLSLEIRIFEAHSPLAQQYYEYVPSICYQDKHSLVDTSECHSLIVSELSYLPHIIVTKSTRKLRVVPHAYTYSRVGMTYSDTTTAGSTLPNRLVYHSHRDTDHSVTLPVSIINMYRQIQLDLTDRQHLLSLWRDTPYQDVRYRCPHKVKQKITATTHPQAASAMKYATRNAGLTTLRTHGNYCSRTAGLRADLDTLVLRHHDAQGTHKGNLPRKEVTKHVADDVDFYQVFIQLSFHQLDLQGIPSTHTVRPVSLRRYAVTFEEQVTEQNELSFITLGNSSTLSKDIYIFEVSHVANTAAHYGSDTKRATLQNIHKQYNPLGWLSTTKQQLIYQLSPGQVRSVDKQEPFLSASHPATPRSFTINRYVSSAGPSLAQGNHGPCYTPMLDNAPGTQVRVQFDTQCTFGTQVFRLHQKDATQVIMIFAQAFPVHESPQVDVIHQAVTCYGCADICTPDTTKDTRLALRQEPTQPMAVSFMYQALQPWPQMASPLETQETFQVRSRSYRRHNLILHLNPIHGSSGTSQYPQLNPQLSKSRPTFTQDTGLTQPRRMYNNDFDHDHEYHFTTKPSELPVQLVSLHHDHSIHGTHNRCLAADRIANPIVSAPQAPIMDDLPLSKVSQSTMNDYKGTNFAAQQAGESNKQVSLLPRNVTFSNDELAARATVIAAAPRRKFTPWTVSKRHAHSKQGGKRIQPSVTDQRHKTGVSDHGQTYVTARRYANHTIRVCSPHKNTRTGLLQPGHSSKTYTQSRHITR